MSAYETFRPADVPWINMIPTHWETKRLKELLAERKESNNPVKTTDILSLTNTRGVIPYAQKGNIGNKSKENLENYKLAYPNDLVLNSMNVIIGSVGLSQYFGAVSPVYYMLYPRKNDNIRYFEYIFKLKTIQEYLKGLGNGILAIRMRIPMIKLNNVLLPVPPREEQDQIVRYLDWQVSKINKLISARKKQIVLLKEQKQAVINEAVTKGLDPAVPMKDSGVEWIGEIPAEWSLVPLYSIAKVISMTNKEDEELLSVYLDEGVIPFSQKEEKRTNPTSKDLSKYQYVRYGNLVLNNQQAWRGSVGVSKFEGIVSPAYIILELSKCLNTDYANLLFRGKNMVYQYGLASKGVGSIQRNLYWPHLKRAFVLLPPLPIQKEIVRYIVKRCAKIDALISNIHSEIALLVEYRTRLISDVVTGQIDVRDIEVPEFEYIADDVDDVSDDENTDLEEIMEEEE